VCGFPSASLPSIWCGCSWEISKTHKDMKTTTETNFVYLADHISQNGITYGKKKWELMREACRLQNVPTNNVTAEGETIDPLFRVKLFDPCGSWSWFIQEYDPKTDIAFGLVKGHEEELGSFSLDELASIKGRLGIGIEIDTHFTPTENP